MAEEVMEVSRNSELQNSLGYVKCQIGNGVAKAPITSQGHVQWCGDCLRESGVLGSGCQGGKIGTTTMYNE